MRWYTHTCSWRATIGTMTIMVPSSKNTWIDLTTSVCFKCHRWVFDHVHVRQVGLKFLSTIHFTGNAMYGQITIACLLCALRICFEAWHCAKSLTPHSHVIFTMSFCHQGPCQYKPPYFGLVKRSCNRPPQKADNWFASHQVRSSPLSLVFLTYLASLLCPRT